MLCNPLWVIKARMQVCKTVCDGVPLASHHPLLCVQTQGSGGNDAHFYRSTWHAVRSILRKEGGSAFYKGIVPSLFGITHVAVQFPLYEFLKRSAFVDQLFRRTLGSAAGPSMQGILSVWATESHRSCSSQIRVTGGTKAPTRSTTSGETAVHVPCMATIIFASTASKLIASSTTYPVGERCFLYVRSVAFT